MSALRATDKVLLLAGALCAGVGVWVLRTWDPSAPGSFFPKCIFKAISSYDCVGCGITRAFHALAHGDILRALDMNPLAVLMLPLVPLMVMHGRGWRPAALEPLMRVVMQPMLWVILLPVYWIARNLPWWPFSWLAAG